MRTPNAELPFSPLVADVLSAMIGQTHDTTRLLIDSLTEQLADSQAEVDAIRTTVMELLAGPYMPTPAAIQRALYPSAEVRAAFREECVE